MMKCEHCGKNEATFYYKSNINGVVKEVHLCADCAAEESEAEERCLFDAPLMLLRFHLVDLIEYHGNHTHHK